MATSGSSVSATHGMAAPGTGFSDKLNSVWHERALQVYMAIVLAHWAEHLVQAYQVYVLHWPRPKSLGLLGVIYPWLFKSEVLHYGYALVMLIGLWVLRKGFTGVSHTWWMVAFWIQFWHHIEHLLLQIQVVIHHNFWGSPVPVSIVQLFVPRIELHLFYNTVVFVPMIVAMYYHMFPPENETARPACTCDRYSRLEPRTA